MSVYPDVSANDLFEAAHIGPNGEIMPEGDRQVMSEEDKDAIEAESLFVVSRTIGLLQTKPMAVQDVLLSEFAAEYLPRLAAAFRQRRTPNNAPQSLINCIGHSPYFMRFSKTPAGVDLARIQVKRMAHVDLLPSEDHHTTVAELCQFLSTLLVVYGLEFDEEDREPLLRRIRGWCKEYRGRFAEETASRCINMLAPEGRDGINMTTMMLPLMRKTLGLGRDLCMIKGCPSEKQEKRDLLQCARCKTIRYCSVEHQKQDWPTHKNKCFSPAF